MSPTPIQYDLFPREAKNGRFGFKVVDPKTGETIHEGTTTDVDLTAKNFVRFALASRNSALKFAVKNLIVNQRSPVIVLT